MLAVVDASVALSWCFEDEATAATDALLDHVRDHGALVPALWFIELGYVLLQAERRQRITAADLRRRLELIGELPIFVDQAGTARAWHETMDIAASARLTLYDATYLELAIRRGLALFTWDHELAAAARRHGVSVSP